MRNQATVPGMLTSRNRSFTGTGENIPPSVVHGPPTFDTRDSDLQLHEKSAEESDTFDILQRNIRVTGRFGEAEQR